MGTLRLGSAGGGACKTQAQVLSQGITEEEEEISKLAYSR